MNNALNLSDVNLRVRCWIRALHTCVGTDRSTCTCPIVYTSDSSYSAVNSNGVYSVDDWFVPSIIKPTESDLAYITSAQTVTELKLATKYYVLTTGNIFIDPNLASALIPNCLATINSYFS